MTGGKNLLGSEKSPYLHRHADGPVHWLPWGDEAFRRAGEEDKPIFLSIGSSTCRWCRVMEKESFRDGEVANLLNDACIPVMVDREERPDVDGVFMAVCQMMNGVCGRPLNVFLTPGGLPFFAASYLPKRGAAGKPGMVDMVPRVKWLWKTQKGQVEQSAAGIRDTLLKDPLSEPGPAQGEAGPRAVFGELAKAYDKKWGGFSEEPKYPMPGRLIFLTRYWERFDDHRAAEMADNTLAKIWDGGIRDHLGGGVARYAADRRWNLPGFEKMLYDQALLLYALAEIQEKRYDDFFEDFAVDIAGFVLRDMTSPEGAFYSAADSGGEGDEGKYYLWTEDEIRSLLAPEEAGIFVYAYGVLKGGNFKNEVTGRILRDNVLFRAASAKDIARRFNMDVAGVEKLLASCRERLFKARRRRPAPPMDDKVLTDWNGLMIAALAKAGEVFERREWAEAAEKAARFIDQKLRDKKGALLHRYRNGEAAVPAFLDDYAFFALGLTELGESLGRKEYTQSAVKLMDALLKNFADGDGGLFFHDGGDKNLFLRKKDAYDGAVPSGNAMAMEVLTRLSATAGRRDFSGAAKRIAAAFSRHAEKYPLSHAHFISVSAGL
ncbi:MAG: thioredoxin domain-containing protein [Aminivibrio sp.]|jgi:uncharacterized protein YyaL (SSP411 family)